jgi:uncharacterized protein DUF4365
MDLNAQKEQFSNAYVRAVAAAAGYNVYKPEVDDDSVDWAICERGSRGSIRSPRFELQLKCSSRDILNEHHVSFPLKTKNYDDLRHDDYQVPRILVVVLVPDQVAEWIDQCEESLELYHCGYWLSLRGMTESSNVNTVTVHLPRTQIFSAADVRNIMHRISNGGLP